jgi:hypothetical protein
MYRRQGKKRKSQYVDRPTLPLDTCTALDGSVSGPDRGPWAGKSPRGPSRPAQDARSGPKPSTRLVAPTLGASLPPSLAAAPWAPAGKRPERPRGTPEPKTTATAQRNQVTDMSCPLRQPATAVEGTQAPLEKAAAERCFPAPCSPAEESSKTAEKRSPTTQNPEKSQN